MFLRTFCSNRPRTSSPAVIVCKSNHPVCTRRRLQLYTPATNLASYQKGMYYTNIFNILSKCIEDIVEDKKQFIQSMRSRPLNNLFIIVCSLFRALFRPLIWKWPTKCTLVFMMYFNHTFLTNMFWLLLWPSSGWNYYMNTKVQCG